MHTSVGHDDDDDVIRAIGYGILELLFIHPTAEIKDFLTMLKPDLQFDLISALRDQLVAMREQTQGRQAIHNDILARDYHYVDTVFQ